MGAIARAQLPFQIITALAKVIKTAKFNAVSNYFILKFVEADYMLFALHLHHTLLYMKYNHPCNIIIAGLVYRTNNFAMCGGTKISLQTGILTNYQGLDADRSNNECLTIDSNLSLDHKPYHFVIKTFWIVGTQ